MYISVKACVDNQLRLQYEQNNQRTSKQNATPGSAAGYIIYGTQNQVSQLPLEHKLTLQVRPTPTNTVLSAVHKGSNILPLLYQFLIAAV
jgi:hypothetical protein